MNSNYINEYINLFERVLSAAYISKFSLEALAKNISNSDYFQKIERDLKESSPITSDYVLVKSILTDINIALEDVPIFNQCLWAAESYLRIQGETKLTFETNHGYKHELSFNSGKTLEQCLYSYLKQIDETYR